MYRNKSKADAGEAVEMDETRSNMASRSTLPVRGNDDNNESQGGNSGGKENEDVGTPRARVAPVAPVENETSYTDFKDTRV